MFGVLGGDRPEPTGKYDPTEDILNGLAGGRPRSAFPAGNPLAPATPANGGVYLTHRVSPTDSRLVTSDVPQP